MDQNCSRFASKVLAVLLFSVMVTGMVRAQAPSPPATSPTPGVNPTPTGGVLAAPTAATPLPPDTVVLKVGDQQFTKAQMDNLISHLPPQSQNNLATRGKKPFGDWYGTVVIFSEWAKAHHLDERPDFIERMAFQKQLMEAQAAAEEINQQTKVGPDAVKKYYDDHASSYDEITLRQILVRIKQAPPQTGAGTPPPTMGGGLSTEEGKARMEAIRKEILAGTDIKKVIEDFKAPGDVVIESQPRQVRRGAMNAELEKVAFAVKDGDVSEPTAIPAGLVMFQVTAHGHVDLKTATPEIEGKLRPPAVDAAITAVKKSAPVWLDDQYFTTVPAPQARRPMGAPGASVTPPKP
jgi:hypothetical protein